MSRNPAPRRPLPSLPGEPGRSRSIPVLLVVIFLLPFPAGAARGQEVSGGILGRVVSESGRPAADVEVTVEGAYLVDYLETREDVDRARIAFYGASAGALVGPIALAVEDRFAAGVLLLGPLYAGPPRHADPLVFAPRVEVPALMIDGEHDFSSPEGHAEARLALLGTPDEHKALRLYPGGHGMWGHFAHEARREILAWLDRYLGPVE